MLKNDLDTNPPCPGAGLIFNISFNQAADVLTIHSMSPGSPHMKGGTSVSAIAVLTIIVEIIELHR